ncbi:MAG: tetratricopeptide repeat protein [Candidatus Berkiella sp.]
MNTLLHLPGLYLTLLMLCAVSLFGLLLRTAKSGRFPKLFYSIFITLFIASSFGFYALWGNGSDLLEQHAINTLKAEIAIVTENPDISREDALAKFAVIENKIAYSDNALAQMANIYIQLGLFDNAIGSLEKAMHISSLNVSHQVQWVYAHSLKNQGKLPASVRQIAMKICEADNTQYILLNLLAIDDYFQGHYAQAATTWETLLIADQSLTQEKQQVIRNALLKAKSLLGEDVLEPSSLRLAVSVKMSDGLLAKLSGGETVFVFVKQPDEGMPLAVIKKKVSDCPFTVDFDSKHSMIAGKQFKIGMKVEVLAKVSQTGDALDKSGEVLARSPQVVLEQVNKPIDLEIN